LIRLVVERMDGPKDAVVVGRESETAAGVVVVGGRPATGLGVDVPIATGIIP